MAEKKNILKRAIGYFKEVRTELKRVTWPTKKEVVASTIVVIIAVMFFSLLVGALDLLFAQIIRLVFAKS